MTDEPLIPPEIIDPATIDTAQHVLEHDLVQSVATWLVAMVHQLGYSGVFIMTFLESTFVPIPAEVTMIPAGYLAYQGEMNVWLVWIISVVGTIAGSYFNYWLACHYGRWFFLTYGKYMFVKPEKLDAIERYFQNHGEISILTGRLIPGLRHFISFPAGLARMNVRKFCIYTGIGGSLWMGILIAIGYLIGDNEEMIHHYVPIASYTILALVVAGVTTYIIRHRRMKKKEKPDGLA
jgi:membrane protein DedA with SNARE-associated domain